MLKKIFYLTLLFSPLYMSAQTVVWNETFSNGCNADCLATGYVGPNGAWTVASTGSNGADANQWYVSGAECGNAAGACGSVCGGTDPSLHMGSNGSVLGDQGAAYLAGGLGFWFPQTDSRAESPVIDLSAYTNMTITFNYIENGQGSTDNAEFWYFDGSTWTMIVDLAKVTLCSGQGTWTAYTVAMPVSANNNPNVKIGFRWYNNNDNVGTDPSFAVDDIEITIPTAAQPTADFTMSATTVCVGQTITFTDASTTNGATTYAWDFGTGASPATASTQGPHTITFNTPGTSSITLTVTDVDGTDDITQTVTVVANPTVTASATATTICAGDPVTLSGSGATSYSWDNGVTNGVAFNPTATNTYTVTGTTSGCTGTDQITVTVEPLPTVTANATSTSICSGDPVTLTGGGATSYSWDNGVTDGVAFTPASTLTYTVTGTTGSCNNTATVTVTVNNCNVPTASFTTNTTTICTGESVTFTDASTGIGLNTWSWNFSGGSPVSASTQGPHTITYASAGTYTITLSVTDVNGTDDTIALNLIVVNPLPTVTANASATTICSGDPVTLTGGGATSYSWSGGVTNGVSFNPTSSATYTVTGTDGNGCENTANISITVSTCTPPVASLTATGSACEGSCWNFSDISSGNPTSWSWTFTGGTPSSSTSQNPTNICFLTAGTYSATLSVTNAFGTDDTTITITIVPVPTVNAGSDVTIVAGESTNLIASASTSGSYVWTPASSISPTTGANITANPTVSTTYTVTFTDASGCSATDDVTVEVIYEENFGVPSAFSPNNDGFNDVFRPRGSGVDGFQMTIYNRYGQVVFETRDFDQGWDGTHNGKDLNPGVFAYVITYNYINKASVTVEGDVTLVK